MADTMKMEYKIFLEAEDVSQSADPFLCFLHEACVREL